VLNDIESKIREAEGERTALEAQLQQAIMAGRDTGKLHTSIDQLTHSLKDLQSAHDGYSRRREQLSKQEEAESKQVLIVKHRQQSDELEAPRKNSLRRLRRHVLSAPRWPGWQSSTNARWANWRPLASDALAERQASSATRSVKSGAVMVCPRWRLRAG
jgi:hypothetical protein